MNRFLLDTSALIRFLKGREPAVSIIAGLLAEGAQLGACAVTVAEFYAGVPRGENARWDVFIDSLAYWETPRDVAELGGEYRRAFRRQGVSLSATDTLVAAVARAQTAAVVTENAKDFPMSDIEVVPLLPGRR